MKVCMQTSDEALAGRKAVNASRPSLFDLSSGTWQRGFSGERVSSTSAPLRSGTLLRAKMPNQAAFAKEQGFEFQENHSKKRFCVLPQKQGISK